jgi:hypothetical protein
MIEGKWFDVRPAIFGNDFGHANDTAAAIRAVDGPPLRSV